MRKSRVEWTKDERQSLGEATALLRVEDIESTFLQLLHKAQEKILRPERRRTIQSLTMVKDVYDITAAALATLMKEGVKREEVASEPPDPVFIPVEVPAPVDKVKVLQDSPTFTLLAILFERLANRFDKLEYAILNRSPAPVTLKPVLPDFLLPPEGTKTRQTRILVLGPKGDQLDHIRRKTENIPVEITFYDNTKAIRDVPQSVDYVIVTRHTGHDAYEKAKAQMPSGRVIQLPTGGLELVVKTVHDIMSRVRNNGKH